MAVNQSLIESARRMYEAEYGVADKSAIVEGIASASKSVATGFFDAKKNVNQKRKENNESFQAKADLLTKIKTDPSAKAALQERLDELKKLYEQGSVESTGIFKGKEKKSEGATKMNKAMQDLDAWLIDLGYADAVLKSQGVEPSKANKIQDQVDNVLVNGPKAGKGLVYNPEGKDPGVYTKSASTGELVRLSGYKAPIEINTEGITQSNAAFAEVTKRANTSTLAASMSTLRGDLGLIVKQPNFISLMFDDISDFNFAEEYIKAEGLTDLNKDGNIDENDKVLALENLKKSFDEDPDPMSNRWIELMMAEGEEKWTEAQKENDSNGISRTPLSEKELNAQTNFVNAINSGNIALVGTKKYRKNKTGGWVKLDVNDNPIDGYMPMSPEDLVNSYPGLTQANKKGIKQKETKIDWSTPMITTSFKK